MLQFITKTNELYQLLPELLHSYINKLDTVVLTNKPNRTAQEIQAFKTSHQNSLSYLNHKLLSDTLFRQD